GGGRWHGGYAVSTQRRARQRPPARRERRRDLGRTATDLWIRGDCGTNCRDRVDDRVRRVGALSLRGGSVFRARGLCRLAHAAGRARNGSAGLTRGAQARSRIDRSTFGTARSPGSVISNSSARVNPNDEATMFEGNVSRAMLYFVAMSL